MHSKSVSTVVFVFHENVGGVLEYIPHIKNNRETNIWISIF